MIRRDRNHPSVIMYSIGNEIPNQRTPDGTNLPRSFRTFVTAKTQPAW
jgi:beta-galactosidase